MACLRCVEYGWITWPGSSPTDRLLLRVERLLETLVSKIEARDRTALTAEQFDLLDEFTDWLYDKQARETDPRWSRMVDRLTRAINRVGELQAIARPR